MAVFNGLNVGSYFGFNDCCWVFFNCFDLLGSSSELGQFFLSQVYQPKALWTEIISHLMNGVANILV